MSRSGRELLAMKDWMEVEHRHSDGMVDTYQAEDLIMNVGKAQMAGLLNSVVTTPFKWIAVGTVATINSATATQMQAEVQRLTASVSRVTTNVTNDTSRLEATFDFGGSFAIKESGVFDDDTSGNMLARQTFAVLNVEDGDSLTFRWNVVFQ